ncbi:sulfite exporter TauE/SafE family protein [Halomonas shantousis]
MAIVLIGLLTVLASGLGTLTGFGTSTLMVPILAMFYPLPQTLLLVGIVHFFTSLWRALLFRRGLRWDLILKFGMPGILLSIVGGWLMFRLPQDIGGQILGAVLLAYVVFVLIKGRVRLPQRTSVAVIGGALYGLIAGIFGIGGAVRGAFLNAFDLEKSVYLAATGVIALAVDSSRVATYWLGGDGLPPTLAWGLLVFVPLSLLGARLAKAIVERIPQQYFQRLIAVALGLIAFKLLLFPASG